MPTKWVVVTFGALLALGIVLTIVLRAALH
jgi:hypothetical protein